MLNNTVVFPTVFFERSIVALSAVLHSLCLVNSGKMWPLFIIISEQSASTSERSTQPSILLTVSQSDEEEFPDLPHTTDVKMEFIKVEIVDMSDPEPCGVKDEEPEEQRG